MTAAAIIHTGVWWLIRNRNKQPIRAAAMPTMKGVRNAPGAGTRERCHCGDGGHRHCDEARFGATETSTGFKPLGETIENAIDHQQDRCDTQIGHGQRAVADQHLHVDEWLLSAQEVKDQHDSEDGQQARPAKWDGRDSSGTTLSSAEGPRTVRCQSDRVLPSRGRTYRQAARLWKPTEERGGW